MILLTFILECFWRKTNYLLDSLRARVRSILLAIRDRWIEYSTGCNFWHPGVRGHVLLWSKRIRSHCLFLTSSDTGPDVISKYACTGPIAYFSLWPIRDLFSQLSWFLYGIDHNFPDFHMGQLVIFYRFHDYFPDFQNPGMTSFYGFWLYGIVLI